MGISSLGGRKKSRFGSGGVSGGQFQVQEISMRSRGMPCIYQITRKSDEKPIYVGSCRDLAARSEWHVKSSEESNKMRKLYDLIKSNGGWENHEFRVLEETKKEGDDLLYLERRHMDRVKPEGNTVRPILFYEERIEEAKKRREYLARRFRPKECLID